MSEKIMSNPFSSTPTPQPSSLSARTPSTIEDSIPTSQPTTIFQPTIEEVDHQIPSGQPTSLPSSSIIDHTPSLKPIASPTNNRNVIDIDDTPSPSSTPSLFVQPRTHQPTLLLEKSAGLYGQFTLYAEAASTIIAVLFFLFILRPKYMRYRNSQRFEKLSNIDHESKVPMNRSNNDEDDVEFETTRNQKGKSKSSKKSKKSDNVFQEVESSNGLLSAGHDDGFAWDDDTCEI